MYAQVGIVLSGTIVPEFSEGAGVGEKDLSGGSRHKFLNRFF